MCVGGLLAFFISPAEMKKSKVIIVMSTPVTIVAAQFTAMLNIILLYLISKSLSWRCCCMKPGIHGSPNPFTMNDSQ